MEAAVQILRPEHSSLQPSSSAKGLVSLSMAQSPLKKMDELVQSQAPALNSINREELVATLVAFIGDYLSFIGVTMNDDVIVEVAQMMIDAHPHIPVDSLKTFFYECKRGSYGYHYNKMDGSKLLMWFDKFVEDYYRKVDDYEYAKHQNTKGDLANPANFTDEEGQPIDLTELLASFHGKTKEELIRENLIKDIRHKVIKKNMNLYNEMSVEEADKAIDDAIMKEMEANNLLVF